VVSCSQSAVKVVLEGCLKCDYGCVEPLEGNASRWCVQHSSNSNRVGTALMLLLYSVSARVPDYWDCGSVDEGFLRAFV
jgi:hypothetical protein